MGSNRWDESTYYEILEISPLASGREVHAAYTRAKETYSLDSPALYTMFTTEEARELLKMIDEAFAVLSNQSKRHDYDLKLAYKGHPAFSELLKKTASTTYGPTGVTNIEKSQSSPPTGPVRLKAAPAPQFDRVESAAEKEAKLISREEGTPQGFGRTRFGLYKIDPTFEKEYSAIEECDGAFIKRIRQYKKVSIDQVNDATRISKNFLTAIEDDSQEGLPAPVFVRGFVLQIARTLSVPDHLADAYMKNFRKKIGS